MAGPANKLITTVNVAERQALDIRAGDTVRVTLKIKEMTEAKGKEKPKEKIRLQKFEGLVIARKHGKEAGGTFTVRRVASGVGVEKIFPLYSPSIEKIELVKRSDVRRSKLYYIRRKSAKEISKKMKRSAFSAYASVAPEKSLGEEVVAANKKVEEPEVIAAVAE